MNRKQSLSAVILAILWSGCADRARVIHPAKETYASTRFTVVIEGASETVEGAVVTRDFFGAAGGVQPMLGRVLLGEEFERGAPVAVISHRYWVERFQSNPRVIGSQVNVHGRPATIVGVAPPRFQTEPPSMLWIPK
jgi:hypothetical protein